VNEKLLFPRLHFGFNFLTTRGAATVNNPFSITMESTASRPIRSSTATPPCSVEKEIVTTVLDSLARRMLKGRVDNGGKLPQKSVPEMLDVLQKVMPNAKRDTLYYHERRYKTRLQLAGSSSSTAGFLMVISTGSSVSVGVNMYPKHNGGASSPISAVT
jgi:hypothetical protein